MAGTPFTVERSIVIPAAPERIYPLIIDFKNWPQWSPWERVDPDMQKTLGGADSGVGATYAWSGNRKAGKGRMEILETTEPSLVRLSLQFEKPFKADNVLRFTLRPEGEGTHVTWRMDGVNTGFAKVFAKFVKMDSLVGGDFENGLAALRTAATSAGA